MYIKYQTETKADGTNVLVAGSVGIPYDLKTEHQAYFGVADMLRYGDGTVRRPLVNALSYSSTAADYSLYDFTSKETFSYTEASAAASHGIAVLYKAEKTAPAKLYIDGLAVSRAGAEASSFGKYAFYSGTSMACPNAAGAAALLLILFPEKAGERTEDGTMALKNLLLSSVRSSEKLKGLCATDGFLDLKEAATGNFKPVISSARADASENTVTLSGVNFGKERGKLSAVHVIGEEKVSIGADEIVSWDEEKIVLKDTKKEDGSYKFRGNYLTFTVQTGNGRENGSTFYLSAGLGGFEKIGKTPVLDSEERKYAGVVTDGSEVYGVTNVGSVYRMDVKSGKRTAFLSIKSAFLQLADEGYFDKLGIDYYERSHDFFVSVVGNPVCMNGVLYEWLSVRASDRKFYLGLKLDVTASRPEWKVISVDVDPKKAGYKKFPKVFLFSGAAASEYKGKIYAAGGYSKEENSIGSILVYVFDPETEEWKFTGECLPGGAFGLRMEESHGRLYAFLGSAAYSLTADFQQPDHRIFCFDGTVWKKLDAVFPFFLKTYTDKNGMVFVNAATAVTEDGILITGASTDGYGDTFLMDTREEGKVSFRALDFSFYGGLNTGEEKYCAEASIQNAEGKEQDVIAVLSEDAEDTADAYSIYLARPVKEGSAYYQISVKMEGSGKGTVRGLKRVKKYGDYKETLTVVPDETSVLASVKVDGRALEPVGENTYQFQPEKDTEVVVTFSKKGDETSQAKSKKASQAKLAKKKKTLRRGKTYRIRVLQKNGQKVGFSISKKAKQRGISVSSSGKIKVKKKAGTGTYYVTVSVKASSKYKAKKLKFKLLVKK
ncbi:MAG: S8 family serine peptidase [Lachnospiraceae bacterium]|nr:S8 family serine peptidase [Lachnospiraceae bacterium]